MPPDPTTITLSKRGYDEAMEANKQPPKRRFPPDPGETWPCAWCGAPFVPARPWQDYCTDACRQALGKAKRDNPLERDDAFQLSLANPNPSFKARKDGDHYLVEFELSKDEWDHFVDPNIDRTGMVIEVVGQVTHRATKPVQVEAGPKGGPLAKWAGILCADPLFWEWNNALNIEHGYSSSVFTERDARAVILKMCDIESRRMLDHDAKAGRTFREDIMAPFSAWKNEQTR